MCESCLIKRFGNSNERSFSITAEHEMNPRRPFFFFFLPNMQVINIHDSSAMGITRSLLEGEKRDEHVGIQTDNSRAQTGMFSFWDFSSTASLHFDKDNNSPP